MLMYIKALYFLTFSACFVCLFVCFVFNNNNNNNNNNNSNGFLTDPLGGSSLFSLLLLLILYLLHCNCSFFRNYLSLCIFLALCTFLLNLINKKRNKQANKKL